MAAARRLYVYGVSGISLLILGIGLTQLLGLAFARIGEAVGGAQLIGDPSLSVDRLSLAIALAVVGLPIWAIHWWLAERSVTGAGATGSDERQSTIRAVHFLIVGLVSLGTALAAAISLLTWLFRLLAGAGAEGGMQPADSLALALIAGGGWAYHARIRTRDVRIGRLTGGAAWLTRLGRHAGAYVGLVVAAFGLLDLIGALLGILVNRPAGEGSDWWLPVLAGAVARVVVGAVAFRLHWAEIERTIGSAAAIGEDDRRSRVRGTYFAGVLLVAAVTVLFAVAASVRTFAAWLLGVADVTGGATLVEDIVGPPLAILPFVAVGLWHRRLQLGEAAELGEAERGSAERLGLYLLSFVGLVFAAAGLARVVGLVLGVVLGGAPLVGGDDVGRRELAQFVAYALAGTVLWAWQWPQVVRRRTTTLVERTATAARSYLYLVVGASLLAAVPSGAVVVYRLLTVVLGADRGGVVGDAIATPLAIVLVAALVGAYHGRLLVRDLRLGAPVVAPEAPPRPTLAVPLVLRGPAGADVGSLVEQLRGGLPSGYSIEVE